MPPAPSVACSTAAGGEIPVLGVDPLPPLTGLLNPNLPPPIPSPCSAHHRMQPRLLPWVENTLCGGAAGGLLISCMSHLPMKTLLLSLS